MENMNKRPAHDQVCKSSQPTTGKLHNLAIGPCPKRFKRKGRRFGSRGLIPTNERNGVPSYLLPTRVVDYYQSGKQIDEACPSWMTPIVRYLSSGELPDNRVEAHKIQVQAAQFSLMNGQPYKRSLDGPYLKYLTH